MGGFILQEVFVGEAGGAAAKADAANKYVKAAFDTCRLIVTVGWAIYPAGYFLGYLCGAVDDKTLPISSTRSPSACLCGTPASRTPLTPTRMHCFHRRSSRAPFFSGRLVCQVTLRSSSWMKWWMSCIRRR